MLRRVSLLLAVLVCLLAAIPAAAQDASVTVVRAPGLSVLCSSRSGNILYSASDPTVGILLTDANGERVPLHFRTPEDEREFAELYEQYQSERMDTLPWDQLEDRSPETLFNTALPEAVSGDLVVLLTNIGRYGLILDLSDGAIRILPHGLIDISAASDGTFLSSVRSSGTEVFKFGIDPAQDAILSYADVVPEGYGIVLASDDYLLLRGPISVKGTGWLLCRRRGGLWETVDMGKLSFSSIPDEIRIDPMTGSALLINRASMLRNGYAVLWSADADLPVILTWDEDAALMQLPLADCIDDQGYLSPDIDACHLKTFLALTDWLPTGEILAGVVSNSASLLACSPDGASVRELISWEDLSSGPDDRSGPVIIFGSAFVQNNNVFFTHKSKADRFLVLGAPAGN